MLRLHKIKRPVGIFSFEVEALGEDEFGIWLRVPRGSIWRAPHDFGRLQFNCLMLLKPARPWVAWWVDDPVDRRLEIDICLPPEREEYGWSYVDLELDLFLHADGTVEIADRDEFDLACRNRWMSVEDERLALETTSVVEKALRSREAPLGDDGWRRLDA